ncbi:hypothetical protein ATANTOWER_008614 [Ataeniobius toweri]|uniref:Uncharacterized protein n=1 Tax=Ataeniobius toweri TaxID=208326 RepID=A0ABU7CHH4_9TELE|nr:hypothetical protein [Ataeniobius toweri]
MFLYSNEGAEFYLWGDAVTAGPSSIRGCGRQKHAAAYQKTACRREPGDSSLGRTGSAEPEEPGESVTDCCSNCFCRLSVGVWEFSCVVFFYLLLTLTTRCPLVLRVTGVPHFHQPGGV